MPKGRVKKVSIDKSMFKLVLEKKGYSINKLADEGASAKGSVESPNIPVKRSLRRMLNDENGASMQQKYLDDISKLLDVDPRLLSGAVAEEMALHIRQRIGITGVSADDIQNDQVLQICREQCIRQIEKYPYYNSTKNRLISEGIEDTITRILSLLDVSFEQYSTLTREQQYQLQKQLIDSLYHILKPIFKENVYGEPLNYSYDRISIDIDSYFEDLDILDYANTVLREKYVKSPPKGYTAKGIQSMKAEEILVLNLDIQSIDS